MILASEASQKKIDNNKVKTTVGPPLLPMKSLHKTPPLTNLRGVRTPGPPPLDPRLNFECDFHNAGKSKVKQNLPNILRLSPSIAHKTSSVLNGRKICEIHNYFSVTSAASIVLPPTVQ